jgi:hypothetical protein
VRVAIVGQISNRSNIYLINGFNGVRFLISRCAPHNESRIVLNEEEENKDAGWRASKWREIFEAEWSK